MNHPTSPGPGEPRTASFDFRGHRLVYDEYGDGPRVVVYLHGLLLDADINRGIAEALAGHGFHVVLLDLLGHGRSDKPEHATEYRIDDYADQVFALLDLLGVRQAALGGISLGANVSLFAATSRPDRVRGLVLEMPVLEWAVPSAALLFVPVLLTVHYGRVVAEPVSRLLRRLPRTRFAPLNSVIHAVGMPPGAMSSILHGVLVGPVAPTIEDRERIVAPTLVLAHRNDLIHPFDDAVNLASLLPNATLLRAWSPLELRLRPERLTGAIATFLDSLWPVPSDPSPARAGSTDAV